MCVFLFIFPIIQASIQVFFALGEVKSNLNAGCQCNTTSRDRIDAVTNSAPHAYDTFTFALARWCMFKCCANYDCASGVWKLQVVGAKPPVEDREPISAASHIGIAVIPF